MTAVLVQLEGQGGHPGIREGAIRPQRQRPDPCPIINPLGNAPIFLTLTRQCTDEERHQLAWRVAVNGFLLLLGSLLMGSHILTFFGLTLPIIRIAGGLVIASVGWKLLSSENDQQNHRATGATQEHVGPPDSFYPLTMPLTVGPGSIAVACGSSVI